MYLQNTVLQSVAPAQCALADSILSATFILRPDGCVSAPTEPLLQLLGYPAHAVLAPLSELLSNAQQAQQLLDWLGQSRGPGALLLHTALSHRSGQALAVKLFASILQVDGVAQAFCAVQAVDTAQRQRAHAGPSANNSADPNFAQSADSALRLQLVTEATGKGVWDWRVDSGEVDYSPLWKRLLGYAPQDIAGHYEEWRSRIHPQDLERVLATLAECLESDSKGFKVEYRIRCKDGAYLWVLSRGMVAERDPNGRPLRIIGTLRNIINRVNARLQLEQSEAKLRAITENTRTVIFMKNLQGDFLHVNRQFETVYGLPRAEVLGKTCFDIFPPELAKRYQEHDQWVLSSGRSCEVEEVVPHADGSLHTYASVKVPIRNERGDIYAICGMDTNVSERKHMQNQMRIAAVAFETPISLMVTDANQVIQKVNQAFVDISGYTAQFAVGRTPEFLRSGKHSASFYRSMWQTIEKHGTWQGEVWAKHRDKGLYMSWLMISSVLDAAGRVIHYIAAETDISERKHAEAALQKLNRALETKKTQLRELVANNEAARENERKHIAREVHDELGQTLTALRMETSFIAMRFGAQDAALQAKVLDMRALVDKAIQSVRRVASNLRPVALDMGLYLALDWLCKDFAKHSGVSCTLNTLEPQIELDEARSIVVFRIVQESLTNIGRYAQADQVRVCFGVSGRRLGVEIQDNGQGFDPQKQGMPTTFGLLGMKERALALGGRLDIVSAPGQGTTIGLSIPYTRPMRERAA